MKNKAKTVFILALICSLTLTVVHAKNGLFPDMDEMFGTAMPSLGLVIGREADEWSNTEADSQEIYNNFGPEEYLAFGQYLACVGAKVHYQTKGNSITVLISVRDATMTFSYDWSEKKAVVVYPLGTRAETEKVAINTEEYILPPVGGLMPSAEYAAGRKPDDLLTGADDISLVWEQFNDGNYTAYSAYLAGIGAELTDSSIDAGVLNAKISLNGFSVWFVYDWNTQTAKMIYPEGTVPESGKWATPVGNGFVLPEIGTLGKELPRISAALQREPSSTETLPDSGIREVYDPFSEADYNLFSRYLLESGCMVDDYHMDDGGILIIHLSNGSGKLTFSYDTVRHKSIAEYPGQTRKEKAWTPTATPAPTSTPSPTPKEKKEEKAGYSEYECWRIAKDYFEKLPWKDPGSLTIHDYSSKLTTTGGKIGYLFSIDYSARNGFGGMNRGYYWITVGIESGDIISAFGNN